MNKRSGFTIVELLVVIVVIGVLAAITIVSYSGVSSQAIVASLKSDLSSSSRILKVFNVDSGQYPTAVSVNCQDTNTHKPSPVSVDQCSQLKLSQGNEIDYYSRPTPQSFILRVKNGTRIFVITDNNEPGEVAPLTAIGDIAGTTMNREKLTSGPISPVGAGSTATYQWLKSDTVNGTYSNISGANNSEYTLTNGDIGKYIKVSATGGGSYFGTVTSNPSTVVTLNPWFDGVASTALAGKKVYYQDLVGQYTWGPSAINCPSPQCITGQDSTPGYTTLKALVSPQLNGSVVFTSYPAQDACKTIGGRLPYVNELIAISNNRNSYGNNFAPEADYWSATQYDNDWAYGYYFDGYETRADRKMWNLSVRCVK